MLALTAETGDIAVRTDVSKSYILTASPASTLANWQELLTPPDTVQSVAGQTGIVTLAKADVGLGSVDNTADTAKPVSTAQQTALDAKVATASAGVSSVTVSSTNKLVDQAANWDTQSAIGVAGLQTLPRHSTVQTLSPVAGTAYVVRCVATKTFTPSFASVACLATGTTSSVKVGIWTDSSGSPATSGPTVTSSAITLGANAISSGGITGITITAGSTYYVGFGANWSVQPTIAGSTLNAAMAGVSPAIIYTGTFTAGAFGTSSLSSGASGFAPFIYVW
jgi:hypothetical protein